MTSAATTRSPSPGPAARPCCGVRRSTDSSPIRSIASTPDPPQRSASDGKNIGGGRASPRASWAEKENDSRHHQRDAARTPKAARHSIGGGAAKSFMAPTFSAASKVVAASASPRKKVLGERNNEPVVPSSPGDHLAHRALPPPQIQADEDLGAPRRLRLSLDEAPAPPPAAAAPVPSHTARISLGVEGEKPVCKVHRHHDEPGDAAAPYDPKTNYLSPRPQFLRYRPNPRVEQYRQSGGSVRRLEDGFASSESSDDTTTMEEEELSDEEQESSDLAPASDATADPVAPVAACVLPPESAPVSPPPRAPTPELKEPAATSPRTRAPTPELESATTPARARAVKKRSSLTLLLVAPLALVLFMAASFVCVPPPPVSLPVVLNASLSKVSDYVLSVQEMHTVELTAWLKEWSSSSLDFVSSYWNALASSREQEFFGPHVAANLTAAAADHADHGVGFYYSAAETRPMPTEQEPISAGTFEQEMEIRELVSASDAVAIAESDVQEMVSLGDAAVEDEPTDDAEMVQESVSATSLVIEELNDYGDGLLVEEVLHAEMSEVSGSNGEEMASISQDLDIPSQSEPEPEHTVDGNGMPSLQQDVQTDESEGDQKGAHVQEDQEAHSGQKLGSSMWSGYLDEFSKPAAGSALAVLIVSAALAFLYTRQNQARVSLSTNEPAEQEPAGQVEQVENRSGSGSSEEHTLPKGSQLRDPVVEETDRIGGSTGTSQYSSSLSSGLGRRKKDKGEQSLQSLEPMSRRESTGYSTSSYGSFTTYEKIPAKKKHKEDEAMTPVRRSSRLKNQVKSPEA